ncbi:hypothetical protein MPSI1_002092 [Malassezia psittaci]|uniref:FUN14 family protein n=1 Tax=Malassezia psittaci TaxID=1821823 RepID=A0AAF0F9M7_9BASI|nr:hypothetical protein MPSI1_002092 [Malassezia psittaci]
MSMSMLFPRLRLSNAPLAIARCGPRNLHSSARLSVRPSVRAYPAEAKAVSMPALSSGRLMATAGLMAGTSVLLAGAYTWSMQPVSCEARYAEPVMPEPRNKEEAQSIVNLYELSFGTVCGLCAGIFIKKGLKLVAIMLGGTYVLLQYLASRSFIKVNWSSIESVYNSSVNGLAGPVETTGKGSYPLVRIWRRAVNFLTADFQQRATFIGGLVLGLRLG